MVIGTKMMEQMRPCVKNAFMHGTEDKDHFSKMRHAIIFELHRLGTDKAEIKNALLEWNQRNFNFLAPAESQRQLCDYVDWFFKKEGRCSCHSLEEYCLYPKGGCKHKPRKILGEITLPFSKIEARSYLEKKYPRDAHVMTILLNILFKIQLEKNAAQVLFVGLRTISARLLNDYRHRLDLISISRLLYKLQDAGFLSIQRGERGTNGTRRANAYTFLPWKPPYPIISHLCNNANTLCVTSLN